MEIPEKFFFSETTRPKLCLFSMKQFYTIFNVQHCYAELNINPANHAPGVKNGPALGVISSHILTMGKTQIIPFLRNHES